LGGHSDRFTVAIGGLGDQHKETRPKTHQGVGLQIDESAVPLALDSDERAKQ
jgi:hypothetical protein